mgnify:CR=1 FL=1
MKYRVKKIGKKYRVQKKTIFGWITKKDYHSQGRALNEIKCFTYQQ